MSWVWEDYKIVSCPLPSSPYPTIPLHQAVPRFLSSSSSSSSSSTSILSPSSIRMSFSTNFQPLFQNVGDSSYVSFEETNLELPLQNVRCILHGANCPTPTDCHLDQVDTRLYNLSRQVNHLNREFNHLIDCHW